MQLKIKGIMPIKNRHRQEIIKEVLNDLELLKNNPNYNQYVINENIVFFEATKSIFKYIWWLLTRAPKIDGKKLLEINDLLPKWDEVMHKKLMEMEKREFPGLITPLINQIVEIILNANRPMLLVNLGCGGMETERQIIEKLVKNKSDKPITFIGVDRSLSAGGLIKENMDTLKEYIDFYEIDILSQDKLIELQKYTINKFLIILCRNDIFELDKYFNDNAFDMIFHTLFKHHLNNEERIKIDIITEKLSKHVIEYDGYLSWYNMIPQTIVGWSSPIFLNAEIFSHLRFFSKKELLNANKNKEILFTKIGYYLLRRK